MAFIPATEWRFDLGKIMSTLFKGNMYYHIVQSEFTSAQNDVFYQQQHMFRSAFITQSLCFTY